MACAAGLYPLQLLEAGHSRLQELPNLIQGGFRFLRRQSHRRAVGRGVEVHAVDAPV